MGGVGWLIGGGWRLLVDWWWVGLVGGGLPLFVYHFLLTTFCWLVGGLVGGWGWLVGVYHFLFMT